MDLRDRKEREMEKWQRIIVETTFVGKSDTGKAQNIPVPTPPDNNTHTRQKPTEDVVRERRETSGRITVGLMMLPS